MEPNVYQENLLLSWLIDIQEYTVVFSQIKIYVKMDFFKKKELMGKEGRKLK